MKRELPQILLVLLFMAVVKDKVLCLKELPYFGGVVPDVVAEEDVVKPSAAAAAASTDQVVKTVKQSNANLDALRRATPDNLRLTATILANRTSSKLASVISLVSEPLEEHTRVMMTKTTTRMGCKQHFIDQAKRESDKVLQDTFALLGNPCVLAELGLLASGQLFGGWSAKEDALIADVLLTFITKTAANEIEHSSFYCMRPPFKFFQYLSGTTSDKQSVMVWCKVSERCFGHGLFGLFVINVNVYFLASNRSILH